MQAFRVGADEQAVVRHADHLRGQVRTASQGSVEAAGPSQQQVCLVKGLKLVAEGVFHLGVCHVAVWVRLAGTKNAAPGFRIAGLEPRPQVRRQFLLDQAEFFHSRVLNMALVRELGLVQGSRRVRICEPRHEVRVRGRVRQSGPTHGVQEAPQLDVGHGQVAAVRKREKHRIPTPAAELVVPAEAAGCHASVDARD